MEISPDAIIIFKWNGIHINATIIFTWAVMVILILISWIATKNLTIGPKITRWQSFLEVIIGYMRQQVKEITQQNPDPFIPFLGTYFYLFQYPICWLLSPVINLRPVHCPLPVRWPFVFFLLSPFLELQKRGCGTILNITWSLLYL